MDRASIQRTAREWLRRLGLKGWHIDVLIVPHQSFIDTHGAGTYCADVTPDPDHQAALMRVCRKCDMDRLGLNIDELESTIVHELLHIRLDPMSALARDSGFEIGLNLVADELTRLARIERTKKNPPRRG
jgi:hypothetical protein